jgi:WD40 repeat protein
MFLKHKLRDVPGLSKSAYQCAWSCDGQYISVICGDKTVQIFQLEFQHLNSSSSNPLQSIRSINAGTIMETEWHPSESNRLAFCGDEKNLEIWDVRNSRATMKLATLGSNLHLAWSRDGNYLVSGSRSDYFLVFDVRTGSLLAKKKFPYEVSCFSSSFLPLINSLFYLFFIR